VLKNFAEYQLAAQVWDLLIYKNDLDATNILKLDFTGRSTLENSSQ
jgi:hypothetical protein